MIKVSNRKAIANLSSKSLKANRRRNITAILAIMLTTIMITALFTIGGSLKDSIERATMMQVGTQAHAGFKFITQEQYDKLAADPKIKDISYNIFIGTADNPELANQYTEIRYTEEKNAKWSFSEPTTGTLPQKEYDIATNTKVLDSLGVPHKIGATVPLQFTAGGKQYKQDFTLSGFWEGDTAMGANEIFLSRQYSDKVAPVITVPIYESGTTDLAGTINPSIWFATSWDIDSQVQDLKDRCGFEKRDNEGVNWAYSTSEIDASGILLIVGVLLLILLSGYLIIYNVFRISVSTDIRFYGLLKTIGTTKRQLKRIVRRQALSLCIIGIPLGLVIGYGVGRVLMPALVKTSTIVDSFVVTTNPLIFVGAAVFALLTVLVSSIRPCRLAGKVSPIEAVRWTGVESKGKAKAKRSRKVTPFAMALAGLKRDRKKAFIVVLSLSLSLILLNATYTIVNGFDMDKYIKESAVTDFSMADNSIRGAHTSEADLNGISSDTLDAINSLQGIEDVGKVWVHAGIHKTSEKALARAKAAAKRNADELPSPYADENLRMLKEDGTQNDFINGIDECLWDKIEMSDGQTLDKEKFATGDYVLATAFWDTGRDPYYKPGEKVTIDFENGNSKTYTVLGLGTIPYCLSQQFGAYMEIDFTLPADEYNKQMGKTDPTSVGFNVKDKYEDEADTWCKDYGEAEGLAYTSKATLVEQFRNNQMMYVVVGGALSIIMGLIGILNFTNAIVTSVHARRRELAMLQSVGMTGKQLRNMLTGEGLIYGIITLAVTVTVGSVLCYLFVMLITTQMWFFTWHFTLIPIVICIPFIVAISMIVPAVCYGSLKKHTVVERLRETE